jgi:hypothetical protein
VQNAVLDQSHQNQSRFSFILNLEISRSSLNFSRDITRCVEPREKGKAQYTHRTVRQRSTTSWNGNTRRSNTFLREHPKGTHHTHPSSLSLTRPVLKPSIYNTTIMMKSAAILSLLSASASAFAPSATQQQSLVSLNAAERSKALPFLNRPPLVSPFQESEL